MKTKALFDLLQDHQDKALIFEYVPNAYVGANYHITEVKHTSINSVDCGSGTDNWNETVIQLWESPMELNKTDYMSTLKALGILKKVGTMKPYDMDAEVKVEYSNDHFHTAQLFVNDFSINAKDLIIKLGVERTDCKAKDVCCLVAEEKNELMVEEPCCTPDGNCC